MHWRGGAEQTWNKYESRPWRLKAKHVRGNLLASLTDAAQDWTGIGLWGNMQGWLHTCDRVKTWWKRKENPNSRLWVSGENSHKPRLRRKHPRLQKSPHSCSSVSDFVLPGCSDRSTNGLLTPQHFYLWNWVWCERRSQMFAPSVCPESQMETEAWALCWGASSPYRGQIWQVTGQPEKYLTHFCL